MNVKNIRESGMLKSCDEMSAETRKTVKGLILDGILAMISGMCSLPEADLQKVKRLMSGEPGNVRPLWPISSRCSVEMAAFLNGYCVRFADWGDAQRQSKGRGGHPSDMIAAALALCDCERVSGQRLIESVDMAYHMWVSVQSRMMYKRPELDPTTALALTTPLMGAVCLGASPERMQNALNLSASSGTILLQVRPADITNLKCGATGYALARALWMYRISEFIQAPESMFNGANGWYKVVAAPDEPLEAIGDEVYEKIQLKMLPCCNVNQAPAWCGLRMHEKLSERLDDIVKLRLEICEADKKIALRPGRPRYPFDHPTADHHIRYCTAAALATGRFDLSSYNEEYLFNEKIRHFIDMLEVEVMSDGEHKQIGGIDGACKLKAVMKDGAELEECCVQPYGYFLGLSPEERNRRIERITDMKCKMLEEYYGYNLSEVVEKVWKLEDVSGRELMDAISSALSGGIV